MLSKVLLTGTYTDGSGAPLSGKLTFAPNVPLTDIADSQVIPDAGVTVSLDSAGMFSVGLYATDNTDLAPAGWAFSVTEYIAELEPVTWAFFLPYAGGATQDISSLTPVTAAIPLAAYLPESGGALSGTLTLGGSPPLKLPSGTSGYVLTSDSAGDITLQAASGGLANPMTAAGDLIDGGSSGAPQRLGIGSGGQVLTVSGGAPAWAALPAAGSGAEGVIQLDGDLGNTAASPQVVSTHLASPLPIGQGGTGTATGAPQNEVFAGPASGTGAPLFRPLVAGDIPANAANTTGTAANVTGTVAVANGGTGDTSLTAYAPLAGGTAPTGAVQSCSTGLGTSGYVLTSNGSASLPSFQAPAGGFSPVITSAAAGEVITYNGSAWVNGATLSLETLGALGNSGATLTVSVTSGAVQTVTLTADCTFTFTNPPATPSSAAWSFTLILTQGASGGPYTASFTGGSTTVYWQDAIAPTLSTTAGAIDVLVFTTFNDGTFWLGSVAGLNYIS